MSMTPCDIITATLNDFNRLHLASILQVDPPGITLQPPVKSLQDLHDLIPSSHKGDLRSLTQLPFGTFAFDGSKWLPFSLPPNSPYPLSTNSLDKTLSDTQLIDLALNEPNPHRRCLFRFKDEHDLRSNITSTITEPNDPVRLVCGFYTLPDGNHRSVLCWSNDFNEPLPTDLSFTVNNHPTYFGPKILDFTDKIDHGLLFAQGVPPNPALVFLVALAYNEAKEGSLKP